MIKQLSLADIDELLSEDFDFSDGWSEKDLRSALELGRFVALGFFEDDVLLGYVTYSLSTDTADIEGLAVKRKFRRKGIATKLLEDAEKIIASLNKEKIFLEVRESNITAKMLYEGQGFCKISVRKKYYSS